MKKIVSIALAAIMMLSLAISVCAYDAPVEFGLYIGDWDPNATVTVDKPGTYTIKVDSVPATDWTDCWIILKNAAGETEPTDLGAGTIIRTTELKINGTAVAFKDGDVFDKKTGAKGELEIIYFLTFTGENNLTEQPTGINTVEVTFVVDPDAAAAEPEAPAEDNTPAETPAEDNTPAETPAENTAPVQDPTPGANTKPAAAPANTGIVLCVLPMAVAAAVVVVSKRK